jgi:hypothetical protein
MAFDWLFGPQRSDRENQIVMRSMVLEPDTVQEVAAMVQHHFGEVYVCFHPNRGAADGAVPNRMDPSIGQLDLNQLASEADWRLRRLAIHGSSPFVVDLRAGIRPTISFQEGEPGARELAERIFERLNNEGRALVIWSRFFAAIPLAAVLVLVGSWVWFVAMNRPPVSLALAGSLVVLFAGTTGRAQYRSLQNRAGMSYPGHRVRTLNREDIRLRRADRHANLRIGVITAIAGAAVSAALIWGLHLY